MNEGGGLGAFLCGMRPGDCVDVKLKPPKLFSGHVSFHARVFPVQHTCVFVCAGGRRSEPARRIGSAVDRLTLLTDWLTDRQLAHRLCTAAGAEPVARDCARGQRHWCRAALPDRTVRQPATSAHIGLHCRPTRSHCTPDPAHTRTAHAHIRTRVSASRTRAYARMHGAHACTRAHGTRTRTSAHVCTHTPMRT